jgi:dihydrofolate reductase
MSVTSGCVVVMGRKTFDSIGKPLKNRVMIVVSRDPQRTVALYNSKGILA